MDALYAATQDALVEVLNGLSTALESAPEPTDDGSSALSPALLDRLERLLEEGDASAVDVMETIAAHSVAPMYRPAIAELRAMLQNYDFDDALTCLQRLRGAMEAARD